MRLHSQQTVPNSQALLPPSATGLKWSLGGPRENTSLGPGLPSVSNFYGKKSLKACGIYLFHTLLLSLLFSSGFSLSHQSPGCRSPSYSPTQVSPSFWLLHLSYSGVHPTSWALSSCSSSAVITFSLIRSLYLHPRFSTSIIFYSFIPQCKHKFPFFQQLCTITPAKTACWLHWSLQTIDASTLMPLLSPTSPGLSFLLFPCIQLRLHCLSFNNSCKNSCKYLVPPYFHHTSFAAS